MLFSQTSLEYAAELSRPSVLALYSDHFIGEVRIKPMLNALLARGIIGDYQIADRQMELVGPIKFHRFSHIWTQRNVSTRQFSFLKRHRHAPLIYDLDDLLSSPPAFVISTRARTISRIEWCLQHAQLVTVTSEKLAQCLREDFPSLSRDISIVRNGLASARPWNHVVPTRRLVWASGDHPYVLRDDPDFFHKLADLANRADYEVVFIGRFESSQRALFHRSLHLPYLDFTAYREFLQSCAGGIGLAPLPSRLPPAAQRYFDSKSDIKLVDFLSAGLVPLCTDAIPYARSDLRIPELAGPDPASLLRLVETCIADPAPMLSLVEQRIYETGRLRSREFAAISTALDPVFA